MRASDTYVVLRKKLVGIRATGQSIHGYPNDMLLPPLHFTTLAVVLTWSEPTRVTTTLHPVHRQHILRKGVKKDECCVSTQTDKAGKRLYKVKLSSGAAREMMANSVQLDNDNNGELTPGCDGG